MAIVCLVSVYIQWRPGIGPPHKADHPGIRTTFFQSQIFPHSHNVLSDSESGPTRDSGHGPPFLVLKHERTRKTEQQKKLCTLLQVYMHQLRGQLRLDSLMGPAVAGSTKGPALA